MRTVAAALFICLASVTPAQGQSIDFERSRFSPAAYYNYGEAGDVTILVNVWGTVRNPGLYEVPQGTSVSTLFSLAGGPTTTVRRRTTKRTMSARLSRHGAPQEATVLEAIMINEVFALTDDPILTEGDVLTVNIVERQRFSLRDVFPIVAAVASVALAVERISTN